MARIAKLDHMMPTVSAIEEHVEGEPLPFGYVPAPDEVDVGWTYSSGHWGKPDEPPIEEPPAKGAEVDEEQNGNEHRKKHKKDRG